MIAEVYCAGREYERTNRWDTPTRMDLHADEHLLGVAWRACPDCGGTGHFPVPWEARDEPPYNLNGHTVPSDFCVACKGQGMQPVMA